MIMNTIKKTTPTVISLEQVNTSSTRWVGHRKMDNQDVVSGQTFEATSEGDLEKIEVFSSLVTQPGEVTMTLHSFDTEKKSWGPALDSCKVDFNNTKSDKWVPFDMHGIHLQKGLCYGFRIESHKAYFGVGEAAGCCHTPPFSKGQEWEFTQNNLKGSSYSYFSLAFKVGLKAA
jgi:hypothetical protein